eukprot:210565_1
MDPTNQLNLPVIDFSLTDSELVDAVRDACVNEGFFYLSNHRVPQELIDSVFAESKRFFDLPLAEKEKLTMEPGTTRGYSKFAKMLLDSENQTEGCQNERFYVRKDVPPSDTNDHSLKGPGKWPEDLPGWKETIVGYMSALRVVSYRIVQLYALALGVEKDYFKKFYASEDDAMTLIRYSAEASRPSDGIYGCGAHSDWGMTTVLATDGVQGLQVFRQSPDNETGTWEDVRHIPGTFVVNIGDMLERWSNHRFRSTRHRVVKKTAEIRHSIPFFFEPSLDTVVKAIETCVPEGEEPKHPEITYADYIAYKMKSSYSNYYSAV